MELVKFLVTVWFILFCIFSVGFFFGIIVENHLDDTNPIKKWWRKHIVAPDPDDSWKNFRG